MQMNKLNNAKTKGETKMKKAVSILLALCMLLGMSSLAMADEEKVEIRFMWWGSQTRHDRTIAAIDMYMEENPNVTISYEFIGGGDYWTKLSTLAASGDVPDVFQIGNNFLTYESIIEPLEPYIESGIIDVSDTNDSYLSTTRIKGVQMGISLGVNTLAMVYDPAMFAEAGVAEPTENWTWEDFEAACLQIHDKLGIYGSSQFSDFFVGLVTNVPQYGTGETVYNENADGLGYENDEYLANYLAMKKRLADAGAYPTPGEIASITDIENDFLVTGKAAISWVFYNSIWVTLKYVIIAVPLKVGFALLVAILLNSKSASANVYRSVYYALSAGRAWMGRTRSFSSF